MKKSLAIILFFCSLTVAQAKIKIPSLIEELSELSSGDSTKVLVLQKLAVELLQSNYDSSLVCARNALALSIQSGEDKIIASSLRQLGDIETYQTELEKEGLSHLYQALAKYKKIENPEGECLTFCNIGSLLVFYDSSYNKGINFLFDALQIAERIHRDNLKLKALNHIAAANFLIQSYAEAIIYYKQCLAIAEKDKSPEGLYMQAEITGNISLCLLTP